ncbi:MAG TPA: M18 family aminopeptidase [Polyangiaceae bacterium]|nr:M18 family aminopeptidase [Polyangiaceae bacterium]
MISDDKLAKARDLLDFIEASPTPFHAVEEAARRLRAADFRELFEQDEWALSAGTRAYVVRDGTLIAFWTGHSSPASAGFTILGAHTDSPNLRLKPAAEMGSAGFRQLAVEIYGGVLLSTWLDRDLALAGRVITSDGQALLVRLRQAICRVPNLAIHLNRDVNSAGLQLNSQTHLAPVLGLELGATSSGLLSLVTDQLSSSGHTLDAKDIAGFDLCLYDTQPGTLGGQAHEFLFSPRLDNLASCHAAIEALIATEEAGARTRVVALYDHEEVGSQSASGARSLLLQSVLERIVLAYSDASAQAFARACARSLLVSADMAHALHPNYADKHDKNHAVKLGGGAVIKSNANQSYATDAVGFARFRVACQEVGFSPQFFASRNDMPCGSTIGPISAARLGIRAVDVGNPMLSMHSCREMAATTDVLPMIQVLTRLFLDEQIGLGRRAST